MRGPNLVEGFQGTAFGLMDGLVTILGVVIGMAQATNQPMLVVVTGVIAGVANSFGNAIGFYASELAEQGEHIQEKRVHLSSNTEIYRSTLLAFSASVVSTLILVAPFLLLETRPAMVVSVTIAIGLLFALGFYVGHFSRKDRLRYGLRYVLLGLAGTIISFLIGDLIGDLVFHGRWIPPLRPST